MFLILFTAHLFNVFASFPANSKAVSLMKLSINGAAIETKQLSLDFNIFFRMQGSSAATEPPTTAAPSTKVIIPSTTTTTTTMTPEPGPSCEHNDMFFEDNYIDPVEKTTYFNFELPCRESKLLIWLGSAQPGSYCKFWTGPNMSLPVIYVEDPVGDERSLLKGFQGYFANDTALSLQYELVASDGFKPPAVLFAYRYYSGNSLVPDCFENANISVLATTYYGFYYCRWTLATPPSGKTKLFIDFSFHGPGRVIQVNADKYLFKLDRGSLATSDEQGTVGPTSILELDLATTPETFYINIAHLGDTVFSMASRWGT